MNVSKITREKAGKKQTRSRLLVPRESAEAIQRRQRHDL
jgi:hypothetical protein